MKFETLLGALMHAIASERGNVVSANRYYNKGDNKQGDELIELANRRLRQAAKFRDWLLNNNARLRAENAELRARLNAQGQMPGRYVQPGWVDEVEKYYREMPDPDEPVAGTA